MSLDLAHVQNQQVAFALAKEAGRGFESVFHQGIWSKLLNPEVDIGGLFCGAALAFKFDPFCERLAEFHRGRKERNRNGVKPTIASKTRKDEGHDRGRQ